MTAVRLPALYRLLDQQAAPGGCVTIRVTRADDGAGPVAATVCDAYSLEKLAHTRAGWIVAIEDEGRGPSLAPVTIALEPLVLQTGADGGVQINAEPRPSPVTIPRGGDRMLAEVKRAVATRGSVAFALADSFTASDAVAIDRETALAMLGMRRR